MGSKEKFYNKGWFMWLMLVFLAPVGIFLMYKNQKYHKVVRGVLSGVFALWFLILVVGINSPDSNKTTSDKNNIAATTKDTQKSDVEKKKEEQVKKTEDSQTSTAASGSTTTAVSGQIKIHYINVGQADSILIQQGSQSMLIDAGNNADSDTVKNYITQQGITQLDYVIGTHPHEDHIGGLDYVINSFKVGKIYMPKATSTTKTFSDVITAIKNKGMSITIPVIGDSFKLGEATCTILGPINSKSDDLNTYSIVIKVVYGNNKFLFTGDAQASNEQDMIAKGFDLSADVLKVGHHGSHTSTTDAFLSKINPQYAVISVGKGNDYGHPHKEVMERLQAKGIKVYRTDENGTIICTSDGKNISFNTNPGSYAYSGTGSSSSGSSSAGTSSGSTGGSTGGTTVTPPPAPVTPPSSSNNDRIVYYTPGGKSYHYSKSCSTLSRSKTILEGKLQDVINLGKSDPCDKCVH